mmetsp:Transcript_115677/g.367810  ORF Transcript_115677/g.367810 Transcript_115677/m.367810 type:complete len:284 (-) Transcript_115677:166-1017(-)
MRRPRSNAHMTWWNSGAPPPGASPRNSCVFHLTQRASGSRMSRTRACEALCISSTWLHSSVTPPNTTTRATASPPTAATAQAPWRSRGAGVSESGASSAARTSRRRQSTTTTPLGGCASMRLPPMSSTTSPTSAAAWAQQRSRLRASPDEYNWPDKAASHRSGPPATVAWARRRQKVASERSSASVSPPAELTGLAAACNAQTEAPRASVARARQSRAPWRQAASPMALQVTATAANSGPGNADSSLPLQMSGGKASKGEGRGTIGCDVCVGIDLDRGRGTWF